MDTNPSEVFDMSGIRPSGPPLSEDFKKSLDDPMAQAPALDPPLSEGFKKWARVVVALVVAPPIKVLEVWICIHVLDYFGFLEFLK